MLQAEYRRNMQKHYMIINGSDGTELNFREQMIKNNNIKHLIPMEIRFFDNSRQYFYDISLMKPLQMMFEEQKPGSRILRSVLMQVIDAVKEGSKYFLSETDYVLSPEHIYVNVSEEELKLCYLPGYGQEFQKQISDFLEYLMKYLNYYEDEAIVLIYGMYMKSKEEGLTFDEFTKIMEKNASIQPKAPENTVRKEPAALGENAYKIPEDVVRIPTSDSRVEPVDNERNLSEREVTFFAPSSYIAAAGAVTTVVIVAAYLLLSGVLMDDFGQIDTVKLAAASMSGIGIILFVVLKAFSKDKKKSRVVSVIGSCPPAPMKRNAPMQRIDKDESRMTVRGEMYSSERAGMTSDRMNGNTGVNRGGGTGCLIDRRTGEIVEEGEAYKKAELEEGETVLLYEHKEEQSCILHAEDKERYQDICINSYPFYIGSQGSHMDYCLREPTISRFHAKIEAKNNKYYMVDLNSTNGTYINGSRLGENERRVISAGDVVALSKIRYIFACPIK